MLMLLDLHMQFESNKKRQHMNFYESNFPKPMRNSSEAATLYSSSRRIQIWSENPPQTQFCQFSQTWGGAMGPNSKQVIRKLNRCFPSDPFERKYAQVGRHLFTMYCAIGLQSACGGFSSFASRLQLTCEGNLPNGTCCTSTSILYS